MRRNLTTESSGDVRCMIKDLLLRTENEHDVELFMKNSNVICKSNCFKSTQKLVKLLKEYKELDGTIEQKLKQSLEQFLVSTTGNASPLRSRWRTREDDSQSPPHSKRQRRQIDTPTRQFLKKKYSPAVAVSHTYMYMYILYFLDYKPPSNKCLFCFKCQDAGFKFTFSNMSF